jgi:hypothetical protein
MRAFRIRLERSVVSVSWNSISNLIFFRMQQATFQQLWAPELLDEKKHHSTHAAKAAEIYNCQVSLHQVVGDSQKNF